MKNGRIFCDNYFEKRESVVREQIGKQLDRLKGDFAQLYSPVMVRLMNAQLDKPLTKDELLSFEPSKRQDILAAVLYNDALWRLEAAYIMLCIGMLNVSYSNLRSCIDDIVGAHIIENLDSEAVNFLKKGEINPTKIEKYIPEEYNILVRTIKETLGKWGVHCSLDSVQLSLAFGPSTFIKMISQTTIPKSEKISKDFKNAADVCIKVMGDVFILFMFLMSKGTKYQREIERN